MSRAGAKDNRQGGGKNSSHDKRDRAGQGRPGLLRRTKMPINPADQKETILSPSPHPSSANPPPKCDRLERGQPLPHQHSAAPPQHVGDGGGEQGEGKTRLCLTRALRSPGSIPSMACSRCWHKAWTTDGPEGYGDMDCTRGSEFAYQPLPTAAFRAWKREGGGWMHRSAEPYESSLWL